MFTISLKQEKRIAFSLLCLVIAFISIVTLMGFPGYGDGDSITHFSISKSALHHPILFLHLWGKPFFILLTTWFAQAGFKGIQLFNVFCGAVATWIGYLIAIKLNFKLR